MRDLTNRAQMYRLTRWFNLIIGIYNLYVYTEKDLLFSFILGCLNIGVWVFTRKSSKNF